MSPTPLGRIARYFRDVRLLHDRAIHQLWESEQLRKITTHYAPDCVFDVGANYGQYARLLRANVGYEGWIVSFEPDPTAAAFLRKAARKDRRWIIEESAISDRDGSQAFQVMADSLFSSLSHPRADQERIFQDMNAVERTVEVKTETLGTAFERLRAQLGFRTPFLKLDTQGYDTRIIAAARDVLSHFIGLQSELSVKGIYEDSKDFRDAIALYEEAGFVLTAFVPNNPGHFPLLIETDCIMIRADLAADLRARLDAEMQSARPEAAW